MPISTSPSARTLNLSTAAAVLLAAAALLTLLGHKPLTSWDEGIYAEVSREMLGGSWIVPHWDGQPWMEKPPLMLWLTAVFFKLFSVSEFCARAASALSGIAIVGILHAWLARREGVPAAWLSTTILLLTFGFLHPARAGELDTLLSLGCVIAVVGLTHVQEARDDQPARAWLLFWLGCAIALMTKGAAGILLFLTLAVLASTARWPLRFGRWFLAGFALFLLVVLPWHLAMYLRFGPAFLHEYLGYHVLSRATQAIEHHHTHAWYFLWILLVSAPPFCLLYPFATAEALRKPSLRPWAIFALVVLVFFSLVRTRLPHYIAPAYPALTCVTAPWIADQLRRLAARSPLHATLFWPATALAGFALFGISAALTAHSRSGLHTTQTLGSAAPLYPDDRELIGLLRRVFTRRENNPALPSGSLLIWRDGPAVSPATTIFYSRRTVQQIGPAAIRPNDPGYDRYLRATEPLSDVLADNAPHLLLLDRTLIIQLPPRVLLTQLASTPHFIIGIARCR